jgi:16S rRNA (guanine527-N7)-methyltransferase
VKDHVRHARGFGEAAGRQVERFLDLGSGGGIPGLAMLVTWPRAEAVLLDSSHRRTEFLRETVAELGLAPRVVVLCARAEEAGRDPGLRGQFPLVVARSFGRPAITAECGSPFLCVGGRLVVSEPPEPPPANMAREEEQDEATDSSRWPASGVGLLGLTDAGTRRSEEALFRVLVQREPCPERYPRRTGVPSKRPLF